MVVEVVVAQVEAEVKAVVAMKEEVVNQMKVVRVVVVEDHLVIPLVIQVGILEILEVAVEDLKSVPRRLRKNSKKKRNKNNT